MSSNSWYLNRHRQTKGPDSGKKRALVNPPYHVHPELEDEVKEAKSKADAVEKKQGTDHGWTHYNLTNNNGVLKKAEKTLKDRIDALDAREKKNHDNENWHFTNPNGHLKKSEKSLLDKINALDARVKELEKP